MSETNPTQAEIFEASHGYLKGLKKTDLFIPTNSSSTKSLEKTAEEISFYELINLIKYNKSFGKNVEIDLEYEKGDFVFPNGYEVKRIFKYESERKIAKTIASYVEKNEINESPEIMESNLKIDLGEKYKVSRDGSKVTIK